VGAVETVVSRRARTLACTALLAAAASGGRAQASVFDVAGVGARGVAEVNARAARADDGSAAFYNPGSLAFGERWRLELAPTFSVSSLEVQGEVRALDAPFGVTMLADGTVPLTGVLAGRVRIGFAGYFLPDAALRLVTRPIETPFFPYYDNRTQRLVAIPALAVRLTPWLGVGAGMNFLAGVAGPADVRPGASGALESRIDEQARTVAAANVGVRVDPAPGVRVGLVYRQRFAIGTDIRTTADIGGVPLRIDVAARQALYDPDTFVLATSFDAGRTSVELDASYMVWSSYDGPFLVLDAELPGVAIATRVPEGLYRDAVSLRAAASHAWALGTADELSARAGAGLETSMLRGARQGPTNLVDGDKVLVGLGLEARLGALLPVPLRLGLGVSAQVLTSTTQTKVACRARPCPPTSVTGPSAADPSADIDNPGFPELRASGVLWSGAASVGLDL
jgi:hypothetical protein